MPDANYFCPHPHQLLLPTNDPTVAYLGNSLCGGSDGCGGGVGLAQAHTVHQALDLRGGLVLGVDQVLAKGGGGNGHIGCGNKKRGMGLAWARQAIRRETIERCTAARSRVHWPKVVERQEHRLIVI